MRVYREEKLMVDIRLLTENTGRLTEKTEALRSTVSQLKSIAEKMNVMWSGKASEAFYIDFIQDITYAEEFLRISEQAAKSYDFALRTYKENEQKAAEIINAIVI